MSDIQLNELNKKLRRISEKLNCHYNTLNQIYLDSGGTTSKTFALKSVHSIAWLVESGSIEISIDGGAAIEYTSSGVMTFDTLNANTILFEIVTGATIIQWIN